MTTTLLILAGGLSATLAVLAFASPSTLAARATRYAGESMPAVEREPLWARYRAWLLRAMAARLELVLPGTYLSHTRRRLREAGLAGAGPFQAFVAAQAALALLGALVGLAAAGAWGLWWCPSLVMAGFGLPLQWLRGRVAARQRAILSVLPDSLDILTACVEAGMGLDGAIGQLTRRKSPAYRAINQEFERYLQELKMGVPRAEALRNLGERTGVDDLRQMTVALAQGDALGLGIGQILRSQSVRLRLKQRQRAEEQAMKAPVKILFPLLFGIFPAIFVVILGPAVLRVIDQFLR